MVRKAVLVLIIALFFIGILGGCGNKTMEWGDFKYNVCGDDKDSKYVQIIGLTTKGMEKQVLIVPDEIDGYPVRTVGKPFIPMLQSPSIWKSEKLISLYFYSNLNIFAETIKDCPNVNKLFILNIKEDDILRTDESISFLYRPLKAKIYIYSYYHNIRSMDYTDILPANITYYYNYDRPPNEGCYWLDNLEDGEKITFIPEDPARERYTFGGWYKEPECINKWDFENDTIHSSVDEYYENKLYAKWE